MEYTPDNWVVLKIDGPDPHYRVLAGWYGGYLSGDSWRLNSGITRSEREGDCWHFYGSSGSCYVCPEDTYRMSGIMAGVYEKLKELHGNNIKLLEDQEWDKTDWDWIL